LIAAAVAVVIVIGGVAAVSLRALSPGGAAGSGVPSNVVAAVVNINGRIDGNRIAGTGMVIGADGTVLTNNHVVAGTTELTAKLTTTGTVYTATVLGVDPTEDVAVLHLEGASNMATVPIETSGALAIGDHVTGLGNALGLNGDPVSASGTLTSLDETIGVRDETGDDVETLQGLLCASAKIQPGDSGGPMINNAGRVIGMDTSGTISSTVAASLGWGCAIPITRAMGIAHQIIKGVPSPYIESGHRGILGVTISDQTSGDGAYVQDVAPGGSAALAGVVPGDMITVVGGVPIHSHADLQQAMKGRRPGEHVDVEWVDSAQQRHAASLVLDAGPPA
jgi:S1-C subfamily serine protease